jgi:hypothetical protein
MAKPKARNNKAKQQDFIFKFIIPENLQDCYVNGAYGGVTPRDEISMHMYSERLPIPITTAHKIQNDGTLSKEMIETKGANVIRLVQSSVIMDVNTAIAIRDWLDEKIKFIEKKKETVKAVKKSKGGK